MSEEKRRFETRVVTIDFRFDSEHVAELDDSSGARTDGYFLVWKDGAEPVDTTDLADTLRSYAFCEDGRSSHDPGVEYRVAVTGQAKKAIGYTGMALLNMVVEYRNAQRTIVIEHSEEYDYFPPEEENDDLPF